MSNFLKNRITTNIKNSVNPENSAYYYIYVNKSLLLGLSNKSYNSVFCSCICQRSEKFKVEKNYINLYFAKMYYISKFIQSLECSYIFSDLGIF